jgi:hypothetical protein
MSESDGWNYTPTPSGDGDNRKLCTLEQDGMTWVGIRIWSSQHGHGHWEANGEPCPHEKVIAWQDLPDPARGYWYRGQFRLPEGK